MFRIVKALDFVLLLILLTTISLVFVLPMFSVPVIVGGPVALILGVRYMGRRRSWPRWLTLLTAMTGLALLGIGASAPRYFPPSRPQFSPDKAQLAARAEEELRGQLDSWNNAVFHIITQRVVEVPDGYRTCTVGISYFYLPLFRYEIRLSDEGWPRGGTFRPWPEPCPKPD